MVVVVGANEISVYKFREILYNLSLSLAFENGARRARRENSVHEYFKQFRINTLYSFALQKIIIIIISEKINISGLKHCSI